MDNLDIGIFRQIVERMDGHTTINVKVWEMEKMLDLIGRKDEVEKLEKKVKTLIGRMKKARSIVCGYGTGSESNLEWFDPDGETL